MSDVPVIWTKWIIRTGIACLVLAALSLLVVATLRTRESARRTQSKNNIKQLLLALHNYHDNHLVFPPGGTFQADGTGHQGWGVMIWPYCESGPWYNQVDINRAWNVGTNAGISHFRNAGFMNPSEPSMPGPLEFGLAHYSANAHLMSANSSVSFTRVADSASVFLVAELAGDFVPWACPYNWRPLSERLNADPPIYGRPTRDGAFFGMADGSVEFIKNDVSSQVVEALRGLDLAGYCDFGKTIIRPTAFLFPRDGLKPDILDLGFGRSSLGWRDDDRHLVKLELQGFHKGENWRADDNVFSQLKQYLDLRELDAKGIFTDAALAGLPKFGQLEKLRLQSDFITEAGLRQLDKQPRLKSLAVSGKQITPEVIERLQKHLPNCEVLMPISRDN